MPNPVSPYVTISQAQIALDRYVKLLNEGSHAEAAEAAKRLQSAAYTLLNIARRRAS